MSRFVGKGDEKAFKNRFFGSLSSEGDEEIDKILEKENILKSKHLSKLLLLDTRDGNTQSGIRKFFCGV